MRLRRQPLLLAAAVGVVLVAALWWPRTHWPIYQGRDVQGWLKWWEHEFYAAGPAATNGQTEIEVLAAFKAMGPDAIPPLVEAALAVPPATLKWKLMDWVNYSPAQDAQLPQEVRARLSSGDLRLFAFSALFSLRPPASLLFSFVTNRLRGADGVAILTAMELVLCVSDDRESVARRLIPMLATEPALTRQILSRLGPAAVVALPELVASLGTTNRQARFETVRCLACIGPGASNALPPLREVFDAESDFVSRFDIAMDALDIGAPGFWAEDETRRAIVGTDRPLRLEVVHLLFRWQSISPRFAQELADLARSDVGDRKPGSTAEEAMASVAIDTLYRSKFDRTAMGRLLSDCLRSTNVYVRINVTDKLLELEPGNASAFSALTNLLVNTLPRKEFSGFPYRKLQERLVKLVPLNPQAVGEVRRFRAGMPPEMEAEVATLLKAHPEAP